MCDAVVDEGAYAGVGEDHFVDADGGGIAQVSGARVVGEELVERWQMRHEVGGYLRGARGGVAVSGKDYPPYHLFVGDHFDREEALLYRYQVVARFVEVGKDERLYLLYEGVQTRAGGEAPRERGRFIIAVGGVP